jgi:hypothetical protein
LLIMNVQDGLDGAFASSLGALGISKWIVHVLLCFRMSAL